MKNMPNFLAEEMKKIFPDKAVTEIILEDIKPEDIFIVQEAVPEVEEVIPAKKPVDKQIYFKRQELVPKDVLKKKTNIIPKEDEDTIELED